MNNKETVALLIDEANLINDVSIKLRHAMYMLTVFDENVLEARKFISSGTGDIALDILEGIVEIIFDYVRMSLDITEEANAALYEGLRCVRAENNEPA